MNKRLLLLILFVPVIISGCNKDEMANANYSDLILKSDQYEVRGEDIYYYNETTGEIRLNYSGNFIKDENLKRLFRGQDTVRVYLNNEYLFYAVQFYGPSSVIADNLVYFVDWESDNEECFYMKDYIPEGEEVNPFGVSYANIRTEREPGWNAFIKQLQKEGRYKR